MNPRIVNLRHTLRARIGAWAIRNHPNELRANIHRWLGKTSGSEEDLQIALTFAIVSASPGQASLIDRFVAQAGARGEEI